MPILSELQTASRLGARAAQKVDGVIKKSMAASASDSIFQFPGLVSNSCPLNMATATIRLLDRTYATFVQLVLSQVANVDISLDRTPVQFLKRMHQNMRLENAVEDETELRAIRESFYDGSAVMAINEHRHIALVFEGVNGAKASKVSKLNLEEAREFLSDYDLLPFTEADGDLTRSDLVAAMIKGGSEKRSRDDQTLAQKISSGRTAPSIMDRDVKKLNDMQPYAIQVRLNVINENNEFVEYWDVVVGVKTILHLIKSDEIIDNIVRAVQNRGVLFNMIRWTTGEISLFKDLILHLDDIKFDMRNRNNGYTAWFPTLKRLRDRKVNFRNFKVNQIVPNASLIITNSDCDILERNYGMNVKDLAIAKRLMDGLFLMTFVILDDATQTVDVLYDNRDSFETYALETLEREVTMNSNTLSKEIGRMISSGR